MPLGNTPVRAVDTNVLVRLLEQDDPAQAATAEAFLKAGGPLWVSHLILAETVWVLGDVYQRTKREILHALDALLDNQAVHLQEQDIVKAAVHAFRDCKADFSDCLALEIARAHGHLPLATFDKAFAKLPGVHRL